MKTLRRKPASIAKTRWGAYAAAGAATALAGGHSAEAAIHYSGRLQVPFRVGTEETFPLDQPGDYFQLIHSSRVGVNFDGFRIFAQGFTHQFRGVSQFGPVYVSKLSFGENISAGNWESNSSYFGEMMFGFSGRWTDRGRGFIGFRFNHGAGIQYGWARIWTTGFPNGDFKLQDYAYADPGEPIRAGQRSSAEMAPDQGSLGSLAAGAVGLLAWRKSRSRSANSTSLISSKPIVPAMDRTNMSAD